MRGIAFIGGDGPTSAQWDRVNSPYDLLVAADSGLTAAEEAGLRPDWIVGDMDSLQDRGRLSSYPPDRVLVYPVDKDFTDTELALNLLWEKGCDEVWIIGGGGGRLDHTLALRALFDRNPCPNRWVTAREDIWLVSTSFEKTVDRGSMVSIFPAGDGPWSIESQGLTWPLKGLSWARGVFGISNTAKTGTFALRVQEGRFLVILPLE
jgi:thiamine pyrophosphokinase